MHGDDTAELREATRLLSGDDIRPYDLQQAEVLILLDIARSLQRLSNSTTA